MSVKMLKGAEFSKMLSSLSPTERAKMLKKRFAGLIAKANPVNRGTEMMMIDLEPKLEDKMKMMKKKVIVNSSSPMISSVVRCNHQGEVKNDISFINHKRKRGEEDQCGGEAEEKHVIGGGGKKERKQRKFDLKTRREQEEEEEKQMKIIARKHQIQSERKAFRLALLRLEKSAAAAPIFDNNYKVTRDYEKLINAPPTPYY